MSSLTESYIEKSQMPAKVSVIIPVFNQWQALAKCIESLFAQINPPTFEIVIIDDGSSQKPPEKIAFQIASNHIILRRQEHRGVSDARNYGISVSHADLILFIDSDCVLAGNCLRALVSRAGELRNANYFQLYIRGNRENLVGKAEDLNQPTIQHCLLQPDGTITWLNTAGFALRRNSLGCDYKLFDSQALRSQDTLLLARLIKEKTLPVFVPDAVVYHCPDLTVLRYIGKGIWTAYREGGVYQKIKSLEVEVRSSLSRKIIMLIKLWNRSSEYSIGRMALIVVLMRYMFMMAGKLCYKSKQMMLNR